MLIHSVRVEDVSTLVALANSQTRLRGSKSVFVLRSYILIYEFD